MKTLFEMRTYIERTIEDDSDPALIDSWINRAIEGLTTEYEFMGYRKTATITPDAYGSFKVPPAFLTPILVYPVDVSSSADEFSKFIFHTITSRRGNRSARNYFMDNGFVETDGATENLTMTNGSTAIVATGSPFVAGDVGEAIRFGHIAGTSPATYQINDSYEYEVATYTNANNITITPAFRGVTGTYRMILKPAGVKKFVVYDSEDNYYTDQIYFTYKVKPQPLFNDYDRLMACIGEAVEFRALIEAYRNEKYNVDADRLMNDAERAVFRALNTEIRSPSENIPEAQFGGMPLQAIHTRRSTITR